MQVCEAQYQHVRTHDKHLTDAASFAGRITECCPDGARRLRWCPSTKPASTPHVHNLPRKRLWKSWCLLIYCFSIFVYVQCMKIHQKTPENEMRNAVRS